MGDVLPPAPIVPNLPPMPTITKPNVNLPTISEEIIETITTEANSMLSRSNIMLSEASRIKGMGDLMQNISEGIASMQNAINDSFVQLDKAAIDLTTYRAKLEDNNKQLTLSIANYKTQSEIAMTTLRTSLNNQIDDLTKQVSDLSYQVIMLQKEVKRLKLLCGET